MPDTQNKALAPVPNQPLGVLPKSHPVDSPTSLSPAATTLDGDNAPVAQGSRIGEARVLQSVRMRFNPIRGLTPELLSTYLDNFRLGYFRNLAIAWDAMERRDDTLQTVAPKCYKSVARHGYEICKVDEVPDGMDALADEQVRRLKFFYDHLSVTDAIDRDVEGGSSLLFRQMMRAKGHKYAVHEIIWQPGAEGLTAQFVSCPLWWFEAITGKLRFLLNEFGIYGAPMNAGEWLVTVGDGVMEAACVLYMYKHLPLKSLLSYLDKFGMPGILGKTDAAIDSKEWDAFAESLQKFAEEWAMVMNRGGEVEILEVGTGAGSDVFLKTIERCDRGLTRLFRGADLGTMSSKDATGASLQDAETEIEETDNARLIEETLALRVSRFVLRYFFGDAPALAYLKINTSEKQNTELDLKVDAQLITQGFPITVGSAAERFNRPLPEGADADALLATPLPTAPDAKDPSGKDKGKGKSKSEMANDALADASRDEFVRAIAPDVTMVRQRMAEKLQAILQLQDTALMQQRLRDLLMELDRLKHDMTIAPSGVEEIYRLLATSFAEGVARTPVPVAMTQSEWLARELAPKTAHT